MNCYQSKIKNIKYAIVFVFMAGVFYFLAILLNSDDYVRINAFKFVGWLGLLYCSCGALFYILRLLHFSPTVIIDEKGIIDYRLQTGLIPWTNIISLDLVDLGEQKVLEVWGQYSSTSIDFNDLKPSIDKVWEYIKKNHPTKTKY
jgi:hypothetical protein